MKVVATGYGEPSEVLRSVPSLDRAPGAGEVAIEVRAAGVNPKDVKLYGDLAYARARGQSADFPLDLGLEASGVVTKVGSSALGPAGPIEVGDAVIAYRITGAYADRIVVAAADVLPKPTRLSWEEAACLMLAATTAFHALAAVRARPGQTLLLLGAAGSVGRCIAQLAVLADVRVVASASARSVRSLDRDGVVPILSGAGLEARVREVAPGGVDAAIDLAGSSDALKVALALVQDRTRIATLVGFDAARREGCQALGGEEGQDPAGRLIRNNARLAMAALAQVGSLVIPVAATFPMSQAAKAHAMLLEGVAGKIALTPSPTNLQ